jgi:hypothetical protein
VAERPTAKEARSRCQYKQGHPPLAKKFEPAPLFLEFLVESGLEFIAI